MSCKRQRSRIIRKPRHKRIGSAGVFLKMLGSSCGTRLVYSVLPLCRRTSAGKTLVFRVGQRRIGDHGNQYRIEGVAPALAVFLRPFVVGPGSVSGMAVGRHFAHAVPPAPRKRRHGPASRPCRPERAFPGAVGVVRVRGVPQRRPGGSQAAHRGDRHAHVCGHGPHVCLRLGGQCARRRVRRHCDRSRQGGLYRPMGRSARTGALPKRASVHLRGLCDHVRAVPSRGGSCRCPRSSCMPCCRCFRAARCWCSTATASSPTRRRRPPRSIFPCACSWALASSAPSSR